MHKRKKRRNKNIGTKSFKRKVYVKPLPYFIRPCVLLYFHLDGELSNASLYDRWGDTRGECGDLRGDFGDRIGDLRGDVF